LRETVGKQRPGHAAGVLFGLVVLGHGRFTNRPFCPSRVRRARADFSGQPTQNEKIDNLQKDSET
jgi:hypothetical protein